jgi:DUF4097 and DUF4098 domain-containing protein YvlB
MQYSRSAVVVVAASLVFGQPSTENQLKIECACPISVRGGSSLRFEGARARVYVKSGSRFVAAEGAGLTVIAPPSFRFVSVRSRGDIDVRGLTGSTEAESLGGKVFADEIAGDAVLRVTGGEIRVGRVRGTLRAISGGSGISVAQVDGEAWCDTAGGEIIIERAGADLHATTGGGNIYIGQAAGAVAARSDGGLIDIQRAGGLVEAETGGGSIQVGASKGARCESAAGAIRLRNLAGPLRARTALGSILTEIMAGVPFQESSLATGQGDITVIIPSNLALSVRAISESRGRIARIVSEFPQVRVKTVHGGPGRIVTAEGSLNGGGQVLNVNASGAIYLRRQQ